MSKRTANSKLQPTSSSCMTTMSLISWIFLALCTMIRFLFIAKTTWTTKVSTPMMIMVSSKPKNDNMSIKSNEDAVSFLVEEEANTAAPHPYPPPRGGSNASFKGTNTTPTQKSSSTTTSSSNPQHPREMIGSWIGKTWIPPHPWRYYDANELRYMYQDKRVLWIGDSTARRAFATMYGILNATSATSSSASSTSSSDNNDDSDSDHYHHVSTSAIDKPSVIDVNRGQQVEFCHKWNNHTSNSNNVTPLYSMYPQICRPSPKGGNGEFSFIPAKCYNELEHILQNELDGITNMTANVDLIVVANGIWEVMKKQTCNQLDLAIVGGSVNAGEQEQQRKHRRQPRNPNKRLTDTLDIVARFAAQTGITIVWRTSGYAKPDTVVPVNMLNDLTMNAFDALSTAVDGSSDNSSDHNSGGFTSNNNNNKSSNNNLLYVNWGKAMHPRSFGPDALAGDIAAHYAMEARLVLVQMITNRLVEHGFFSFLDV